MGGTNRTCEDDSLSRRHGCTRVVNDMLAIRIVRMERSGFGVNQHNLIETAGPISFCVEQVGVVTAEERGAARFSRNCRIAF